VVLRAETGAVEGDRGASAERAGDTALEELRVILQPVQRRGA
jgi:hypothetical protein